MKTSKYVKVHWRDATSVDAWTPTSEITPECHMIETLGILVTENEETIVVALNHDPEGEAYSQFITIPKPWIIQRKNVKA